MRITRSVWFLVFAVVWAIATLLFDEEPVYPYLALIGAALGVSAALCVLHFNVGWRYAGVAIQRWLGYLFMWKFRIQVTRPERYEARWGQKVRPPMRS